MMTSILRFFLKTLLVLTCTMGITHFVWADVVTVGTGAAKGENIFTKIGFPLSRTRNVQLEVLDSGPIQGWKDVDAGKVHCAVAALPIADWIELMKKEGYDIPDLSVYRHWVIGHDKIKVLVNTDVAVTSLSREQLQKIFSGAVNNWSQVNGPDKPIIVVLGTQSQGMTAAFKNIMGNVEFTKSAMMGTTAEDVKDRIIRNSGAIGFGTITQINHQLHSPDAPEVKCPITLVAKGKPPEALLKMIDFIEKDGQRYIIK